MFSTCDYSYLARLSLNAPFQTELAMNTHVTVSDIRHDVSKIREEIGGQVRSVSANLRPFIIEC